MGAVREVRCGEGYSRGRGVVQAVDVDCAAVGDEDELVAGADGEVEGWGRGGGVAGVVATAAELGEVDVRSED